LYNAQKTTIWKNTGADKPSPILSHKLSFEEVFIRSLWLTYVKRKMHYEIIMITVMSRESA